MTTEFRPDGPHTPDYTRAAVAAVSEGARTLSHAILGGAGLAEPSDVCDVLGALAEAASGFQQTLDRLAQFIHEEGAAGRLVQATDGRPRRAGTDKSVAVALTFLQSARTSAGLLNSYTAEAQRAVGGLRPQGPPDDRAVGSKGASSR